MKTLAKLAPWLLTLALAAAGCSGPTTRVLGTVLLDGKPLADASLHFWPKEDLELGTYRGRTGPDGRFVLEARPGMTIKPGLYLVLVGKDVKKDGTVPTKNDDWSVLATPGMLRNILPPVYADRTQTPLTAEVKPGLNDLPPFELSSTAGQ